MRVLVAIPHFYRPTDLGYYGSLSPDHGPRLRALAGCLTRLHQSVGPRQRLLYAPEGATRPCNGAEDVVLDIVVCTAGNDHLVDALPPGLCWHRRTDAAPPLLGYECHAVLRDNLGRYDWYVYLEDDLGICDPLFFDKLRWFAAVAGDSRCVLQPNRFETCDAPPLFKLYIDGPPKDTAANAPRTGLDVPEEIRAPFLEREVRFRRVDNPHSGTFFLTDEQMRRWAGMPDFLDRASSYIGPLESAATLGLIRHFAVYKPSRENAGFLEIEHGDTRYLGRRLEFSGEPPFRYRLASNRS